MDEKLNTYLIEVNTNPCLEESNELLKNLLPRMLDDMLNIVLDPFFNYHHLYKDQLRTQATDPRTDHVASPQHQERFAALCPHFDLQAADMPYDSVYSLPGRLFEKDHPGYPDDQNLWEQVCVLD